MRTRTLAALLVAALLAPASGALASHMSSYATTPVEHDDLGRGVEPDGVGTGVLGAAVRNCVVDLSGDAVCEPDANPMPPPPAGHSRFINPGCMGDGDVPEDGHNRLSGQCGLWTVGLPDAVPRHTVPAPASEDGRCAGAGQSFPPGRYSGNTCPGNVVRFLDAVRAFDITVAGVTQIEVNRKVDDTPLRGTVVGQDFVAGATDFWAWYGFWQDKNGNGVIDSRADFNPVNQNGNCVGVAPPCDGAHAVAQYFPDEEFTWVGNCMKFPDIPNPGSVASGYCALDVEAAQAGVTRMVGWMWPGNHHAYCGGYVDPLQLTCSYIPADIPGRQAIHFVGAVGQTSVGVPGPCAGLVGIICETNLDNFDESDELYYADPLLGPQGGVRVDQEYEDRSGEPDIGTRQWTYGLGWSVYFYDTSTLSTMVEITGAGCQPGGPAEYIPSTCRFLDVDVFEAWNPTVANLLGTTVKPALRANWVFVRDGYIPLNREVDGVMGNRLLSTAPVTGPLNDASLDPGFSREPNDAGDGYPAAQFNARGCVVPGAGNGFNLVDAEALHRGWCNAYDAHRAGPRGYADLTDLLVLHENRPITFNALTLVAVSGVFAATTMDPLAPVGSPSAVQRAEGDHRRTLMPGKHLLGGLAGQWHDRAHAWDETVFLDLPALGIVGGQHTNPPDGWVGNLVENIGAWYYRGYADAACDTDQPAWAGANGDLHSWAECNPYRDGEVENPQAYGIGTIESPTSKVVEWTGRCDGVSHGADVPRPAGVPGSGVVTLEVEGGVWDFPVLVWRDTFQGIRVRTAPLGVSGADLVDLTGTQGPIELKAACGAGARPGGVGVTDLLVLPMGSARTIRTTVQVSVAGETVTDVDTYHALAVLA